MSKIIGIDLGSTASAVAILEGENPSIIVNSEGERTTNSIVAYKGQDILVGKAAKNQAIINPKNTVSIIKRFIGRKYKEAYEDTKLMPYEIIEGSNGDCRVKINDKLLSPEEISAQILIKLKKQAENYLGEPVTEAVITVPAYFNDAQRQATKDAGKIAGLEVKRIINEPTACCLSMTLKEGDKNILVVDLGGATADFSILSCGDGVYEVLATSGNSCWGGSDLDHAITQYLIEEFKKQENIDLSKDNMALQRLNEAAEKAKIELSTSGATDINLPFITATSEGPKHLQLNLTRAKFEQLIEPIFDKLKVCCSNVMRDSKLDFSDIDEVVLCGGTTRVPYAQKFISEQFHKTELNHSVNPDEAVALGAAIQAGVLSGDVKDVLLLDVTPLSLGIETMGGVMTKLIERNTTVPTSKTQIFTTAADGQTAVTVHVLQGEREFARDNKTLGNFNLDGIPVAPRGLPQIEVKFDVDANGILTVTAKDLGTGKEQHITITGGSGLSDAEIEKAVNEAKIHEEEDKKLREKVDTRNEAESLIFNTRKSLNNYGDKLSAEDRLRVETAVNSLEEYLKEEHSTEDIKSKIAEVRSQSFLLAQKIYGTDFSNLADGCGGIFNDLFGKGKPTGNAESTINNSSENNSNTDYEVVE